MADEVLFRVEGECTELATAREGRLAGLLSLALLSSLARIVSTALNRSSFFRLPSPLLTLGLRESDTRWVGGCYEGRQETAEKVRARVGSRCKAR